MRAGTDGFVRRLLVEPGRTRDGRRGAGRERRADARRRARQPCRRGSPSWKRRLPPSASPTASRPRSRRRSWRTREPSLRRRPIAPGASSRAARARARFAVLKPQDLPGRFIREGQEIGYVLPAKLAHRPRHHSVRMTSISYAIGCAACWSGWRSAWTRSCRLASCVRCRPVAMTCRARPSGDTGGGARAHRSSRPASQRRPYNRVFQVDLELPAEIASAAAFGSRAYVRFDLEWEPLGQQIWRRARQLLLSRLHLRSSHDSRRDDGP